MSNEQEKLLEGINLEEKKRAQSSCVCIKIDKHKTTHTNSFTLLTIHNSNVIHFIISLTHAISCLSLALFQPSRLPHRPTQSHSSTPTWQYAGLHFTFVQSALYYSIHCVLESPDYTTWRRSLRSNKSEHFLLHNIHSHKHTHLDIKQASGGKQEHHINKTKIISHRQKTWEMCNVITIMNMNVNVREWRGEGDKKTRQSQHWTT
jgi:hypothetical protein